MPEASSLRLHRTFDIQFVHDVISITIAYNTVFIHCDLLQHETRHAVGSTMHNELRTADVLEPTYPHQAKKVILVS